MDLTITFSQRPCKRDFLHGRHLEVKQFPYAGEFAGIPQHQSATVILIDMDIERQYGHFIFEN